MPSRSPLWDRRRAIEDAMAILADCDLDAHVLTVHVHHGDLAACDRSIGALLGHARAIGHGPILDETYRLRRHFREFRAWLAREWKAAPLQTAADEGEPCSV